MKLIKVSSLNFTYKSWVKKENLSVFENLNFEAQKGSHILILSNPEGGKTTFSRIINCLVPKFIEGKIDGKVEVCGKDVLQAEPYQLIKDICYVSQNPTEMFIMTTVENEIAFPLESLGIEKNEIKKIVKRSLADWGLTQFAKASPNELSGGEKKRLALASAFAINPKIYVLDEAFDDLDKTWREFLSKRINKSKNTFIILSARFLSQFRDIFDKIYLLDKKKIEEITQDTAIELFTHKDIDLYLKNSLLRKNYDERKKYVTNQHRIKVSSLYEKRVRKSVINEVPFELNCANFEVSEGEIIRLVGKNGSGKSTFSRILCGLDNFSKGYISLDNKKIESNVLNSNIGYLFQNPDYQIFLPTVFEELAWGLEHSGNYNQKEIKKRVEECANIFGLDLNDTPTTMSFALRKKLQAAVYYLLERPFLILDELDGAMSYEDAYFIINQLSKRGTSLIIITHDDDFAIDIADKTYFVEKGKVDLINEC